VFSGPPILKAPLPMRAARLCVKFVSKTIKDPARLKAVLYYQDPGVILAPNAAVGL
jgi:hypothetical protein